MRVWNRALAAGLLVAGMSGATALAQAPKAVELGSINFPTSAKPAAQAPFLTGVKALYNFEFDIAADAFRDAQKADPSFALAYWGESLGFNHPLWFQEEPDKGRAALRKLG